jgi:hypothetical protein
MQPRVSLWEDIQAFTISLYSNKIANGILLGSGTGQEMAELADHLAHEGTGLIMEAKDVIILLFPNRGTLEEDGPPPRSTIGYEIRRATEYTTDEDWMEPADEDGDWSLWFRKTFGMDIEALFQWPTNPNVIKKEVFLMLDECQEAELEALSRCFRWMGVTVYTAESPGAWNEFKTRNEGVVIVSFIQLNCKIEHLFQTLEIFISASDNMVLTITTSLTSVLPDMKASDTSVIFCSADTTSSSWPQIRRRSG